MFYVKLLFVTALIAFAAFVWGYKLAEKRVTLKLNRTKDMWHKNQDVQQLIDRGLLRIVGMSKPTITLLNGSSMPLFIGSLGVQIEPRTRIKVEKPE